MTELGFTFCRGYVNNTVWPKNLANEWKYASVSVNLIEVARRIVYKKGVEVTRINPQDRRFSPNIEDYLFQGNLVRINFFRTAKPVPLCGPDIELHSETDEGLANLIKDLGLPDNK